jgi:hypothetical protein
MRKVSGSTQVLDHPAPARGNMGPEAMLRGNVSSVHTNAVVRLSGRTPMRRSLASSMHGRCVFESHTTSPLDSLDLEVLCTIRTTPRERITGTESPVTRGVVLPVRMTLSVQPVATW